MIIPNSPSFPIIQTSFTQGDENDILGGERDILFVATSGKPNFLLTAGVYAGEFTCDTPSEATGYSILQYDGIDESSDLNSNGLGNLDFTKNNAFALRTFISSDMKTNFNVTIYSENRSCFFSMDIEDSGEIQEYVLEYEYFDGNCDFTNVNAVEFAIEQYAELDLLIEEISTYGPVF